MSTSESKVYVIYMTASRIQRGELICSSHADLRGYRCGPVLESFIPRTKKRGRKDKEFGV